MDKRTKLIHCLNAPQGINRPYFGGMARFSICKILGCKYGACNMKLEIQKASDATIERIYEQLDRMIEGIWRHGLCEGRSEQAPIIWARSGQYQKDEPADTFGWTKYVLAETQI